MQTARGRGATNINLNSNMINCRQDYVEFPSPDRQRITDRVLKLFSNGFGCQPFLGCISPNVVDDLVASMGHMG